MVKEEPLKIMAFGYRLGFVDKVANTTGTDAYPCVVSRAGLRGGDEGKSEAVLVLGVARVPAKMDDGCCFLASSFALLAG